MNFISNEDIFNFIKNGGNKKAEEKYLKGKFSIDDTPNINKPQDIKKYIYKVFIESEKELVDKKIRELEALKQKEDEDSDSETERLLTKQIKKQRPKVKEHDDVFSDLIHKRKGPASEEDDWDPFK